jgi:hypothetical protein
MSPVAKTKIHDSDPLQVAQAKVDESKLPQVE